MTRLADCGCRRIGHQLRDQIVSGKRVFRVYGMAPECGTTSPMRMTLDLDTGVWVSANLIPPTYLSMAYTNQSRDGVQVQVLDSSTDEVLATYKNVGWWTPWRTCTMRLVSYKRGSDYIWKPYACLEPIGPEGTGGCPCLGNSPDDIYVCLLRVFDPSDPTTTPDPNPSSSCGRWYGWHVLESTTIGGGVGDIISCRWEKRFGDLEMVVSFGTVDGVNASGGISFWVYDELGPQFEMSKFIDDDPLSIDDKWCDPVVRTTSPGVSNDPNCIHLGVEAQWIKIKEGDRWLLEDLANVCPQGPSPCTGSSWWKLKSAEVGENRLYWWENVSSDCENDCNAGTCNPRIPFPLPLEPIDQEEAEDLLIWNMEEESFEGGPCACVPAYVPPALPCAADPGDPPIFRLYVTRNGVSGKYIVGWYLHDIGAGCEGSCETNSCTVHPPEEPVVPSGELTAEEVEAEWSELLGVDYIGRCICATTWSPPETECPDCASTSGVTMIIHINMPPFVDEDVELGKTSGQCRWAGYGFGTGADNEFRLTWAAGVWTLVLHDTMNDVQLAQWSGLGRSCDWFGWLTKVSGGSQWPAGVPMKRKV